MNIKDINKILDKYFEAETSIEEELLLKEYFSGDVAPELEKYKSLFVFIEKESEGEYPLKVAKPKFAYLKYTAVAALILISATITGLYVDRQMEIEREREITKEALLVFATNLHKVNLELEKLNLIEENIYHLQDIERIQMPKTLLSNKLQGFKNEKNN